MTTDDAQEATITVTKPNGDQILTARVEHWDAAQFFTALATGEERRDDAMKEPISFTVWGKPEPAGSKRAFVLKRAGQYTGRAIVTDDNKKSKPWQAQIRSEAAKAYLGHPWDCPIALTLIFTVIRPKGHFGSGRNANLLKPGAPPYPTTKPDATKLCRGVEDALTGVLWKDDAQVVTQRIIKRYGGKPGVVIEIREETRVKSQSTTPPLPAASRHSDTLTL